MATMADISRAIFDNVPTLFPEHRFSRRPSGGWISPLKLDLSTPHEPRRDKTYISQRVHYLVSEHGGETLSTFALYKRQTGLSGGAAFRSICQRLNLPMSEDEVARAAAAAERIDKIVMAISQSVQCLHNSQNNAVKAYLKDVRHYDEQFISFAKFGANLPASGVIEAVKSCGVETDQTQSGRHSTNLPQNMGQHALIFPFVSLGRVIGFCFRTLATSKAAGDKPEPPKYYKFFFDSQKTQQTCVFGTPSPAARNVVLCEGEIDALRAQYASIDAIAAGSNNVTPEALRPLEERGVRSITVLYDRDEAGTKMERVTAAVKAIKKAGFLPFVSLWPEGAGKCDIDSYLRDHEPQDLQAIIAGAISGARWLYRDAIASSRIDQMPPSDIRSALAREKAAEVIASQPDLARTDKADVIEEACRLSGAHISIEDISEDIAARAAAARKEKAAQDVRRAAISLSGNPAAADDLQQALNEFRGGGIDPDELLGGGRKISEMKARLLDRVGVETGYEFFDSQGNAHPLRLRAGALTVIAAQPSHGKTRFLENLAYQASRSGKVAFFSYEMSGDDIALHFINLHCNVVMSGDNLSAIRDYICDRPMLNYSNVNEFAQRFDEIAQIIESGQITINDSTPDIARLCEAIRIARRRGYCAVFIDYVQIVKTDKLCKDRREAIGEVVTSLITVAKETGMPIILAAQTNREAAGPDQLFAQSLAESANIEQGANLVICLNNSAFRINEKKSAFTGSKLAAKLAARGFNPPEAGCIYALVVKNRDGLNGVDSCFGFNGATGLICNEKAAPLLIPDPDPEPEPEPPEYDGNPFPF